MAAPTLPPWPPTPPAHGAVLLRPVEDSDAAMAQALSTDSYVPTVGTLPAEADREQSLAWVARQQARHAQGAGFSCTIVEVASGQAVGHCGLWLQELADGRATAGYAIIPAARGRGLATAALSALTGFGWTLSGLHRIALYIEPWNIGSIRTAAAAGYVREGLLRSHQEIAGQRRDMLLYAAVRPSPAPVPFQVHESGSLFHGTKADLAVGDLLTPGRRSNYGNGRIANHVYLSATLDAATWGAELAAGPGRGRIYVVEPTGPVEDDPNLTDKRFPGNPTRSYRTRKPVTVVGEVLDWVGHPAEQVQARRVALTDLQDQGRAVIDD